MMVFLITGSIFFLMSIVLCTDVFNRYGETIYGNRKRIYLVYLFGMIGTFFIGVSIAFI